MTTAWEEWLDLLRTIGSIGFLGSLFIIWFNNQKNKTDLCLKMYERWISESMTQNRQDVWGKLKKLYACPDGYTTKNLKLSELKYLDENQDSYKGFYRKFIQIMFFFADLNKLMRQDLIDNKLARTMFSDSILPWYDYYLKKIEFDPLQDNKRNWLKREIPPLEEKLKSSFSEVNILHIRYKDLERKYQDLERKYQILEQKIHD